MTRAKNATPSNKEQSTPEVLEALAAMEPFDPTSPDNQILSWIRRISRALWVVAGLTFVATALIALVHFTFGVGSADELRTAGFLLGMATIGMLLLAFLFSTALQLGQLILMARRGAELQRAAYEKDVAYAKTLASAKSTVLNDANFWLELSEKRIERRLIRVIGGSEKLGLVVIIGAGYAAWKEISPLVDFSAPSFVTVMAAFVVGLVIGALSAANQRDRIAYQRELIQLALRQQGVKPESPSASALPSKKD